MENQEKYICENCYKEHDGSYGSGRFCSQKCARGFATKFNRKETNEKVSRTLKSKHPEKPIKYCKECNAILKRGNISGYCKLHFRKYVVLNYTEETISKLRRAGMNSAKVQKDVRRSKNEMLFCSLCEQYFKDVKHNENLFNDWDADVIVEDYKIAVLWNGKWHYENICGKLEQIQNRDKIKINEIIKCNYIPYVIKDMGKYNEDFVKQEFNKFLKFIDTIRV